MKMLKFKLFTLLLISVGLMFSSCSSSKWAAQSNQTKGGILGGTGGAAVGAGLGAILAKKSGKGAVIGAAVGGAVGTGAGILIGKKMDKQQAELERIEGAQVETVTDSNNLQAIKVTFDSGILFATGKSNLSTASKDALARFASSLRSTPETDVTIYGHTDNTGSREINEKLSNERAESVAKYLIENGVSGDRLATQGKAYDEPVASNETAEGRALNRRVEIYITANETMIQQAEQGNLN
ncbi:OmpA family protein [Mangrovibacterium marinum]|uniref:Outer membrane protein OmpA-like peptidoglycan-associated protein n=1 Tax=Mangrovibacterium marinum TaxID=1639118 RepID=A0A2T5C237_9BACT|nr:OmpA family protein [Mangrovibacterium marinum]PTN08754.1 outer membrane protein OmpA-like peptidoglycan-associated protein [Mangrovibacterium marinum]